MAPEGRRKFLGRKNSKVRFEQNKNTGWGGSSSWNSTDGIHPFYDSKRWAGAEGPLGGSRWSAWCCGSGYVDAAYIYFDNYAPLEDPISNQFLNWTDRPIPDEYNEGTVRPDMDGKMKDFEEGLDEASHLDFKKIADEADEIIPKKASGGSVDYDNYLPDIEDIE